MIIKKIDSQKLPEYIIIGGGPAGITTATQLGRKINPYYLLKPAVLNLMRKYNLTTKVKSLEKNIIR